MNEFKYKEKYNMTLTILGLVYNLVGTVLLAVFGTSVTSYSKDGSETFSVTVSIEQEKANKERYTNTRIIRSIGWVVLLEGFVLQLVSSLL